MTTIEVTRHRFSVEITAATEIDATPERVWAVLTDTAAYPTWNPFLRRLEGSLEVGSTLTVDLRPREDATPRTMTPRVVDVTPGRSFAWLGQIAVPGVLDGRHAFTVEPMSDGSSRFVQHERLSGLLVPFFRTLLTVDTPRGFAAMNDALATRVVASNGTGMVREGRA
jgi:hypothetical protein